MEMKCIKNAARLLDIDCVNKRGLDLSKEALWVSVGQRATVLRAVKVGGKRKNSANQPCADKLGLKRQSTEFLFDLQL